MSELNYLAHYQVKGAKHGVRRYQNYDGSLTPLGRVHYGVGEARKKASDTAKKVSGAVKKAPERAGQIVKSAPKNIAKAAKSAPKNIAKSAKNTISQLARDRKSAVAASKARRKQAKIDRANRREERRKEKAENLRRKIEAKASKKKLSELREEFEDAKLNDARNRIDRLLYKQERIQEKAYLKEQERAIKRSMKKVKKDAVKDARKKFSRKDIKDLSDEELNARINRLQQELKLAGLEAQRSAPKISAGAKWVSDTVGEGMKIGARQLAGTMAVKYGKNALNLTDEDISEFVRLTKKK